MQRVNPRKQPLPKSPIPTHQKILPTPIPMPPHTPKPFKPPSTLTPPSSLQTNTHKLLPINRPIAIEIKFINHRRQLLLAQPFPQLPRHAPQIRQVDLALAALVEELKRAQDLVARVARQDALRQEVLEGGQRQEEARRVRGRCGGGWVGGGSGWLGGHAVLAQDGDELRFGDVEAEGLHGDFELVVVDALVPVEVEEPELYGSGQSISTAILNTLSLRAVFSLGSTTPPAPGPTPRSFPAQFTHEQTAHMPQRKGKRERPQTHRLVDLLALLLAQPRHRVLLPFALLAFPLLALEAGGLAGLGRGRRGEATATVGELAQSGVVGPRREGRVRGGGGHRRGRGGLAGGERRPGGLGGVW